MAGFVFAQGRRLGGLFLVAPAEVSGDFPGDGDVGVAVAVLAFEEGADGFEGAVEAVVLGGEDAVEGHGTHVAGGGESLLLEPDGDGVLADHVALEGVDGFDVPGDGAEVACEGGVAVGFGLVVFRPEPVLEGVGGGDGLAAFGGGAATLATVLTGSLLLSGSRYASHTEGRVGEEKTGFAVGCF
jgi:hypothetical protein